MCINISEDPVPNFTAIFTTLIYWQNFKDVWGGPYYCDFNSHLNLRPCLEGCRFVIIVDNFMKLAGNCILCYGNEGLTKKFDV